MILLFQSIDVGRISTATLCVVSFLSPIAMVAVPQISNVFSLKVRVSLNLSNDSFCIGAKLIHQNCELCIIMFHYSSNKQTTHESIVAVYK